MYLACLRISVNLHNSNNSVRPPKKSWKQIGNLSGGEKTLASLSFVFGLHTYRPSPFYVSLFGCMQDANGLIVFKRLMF